MNDSHTDEFPEEVTSQNNSIVSAEEAVSDTVEPPVESPPETSSTESRSTQAPKSTGKGIAWLALLLGLVAAGFSAFSTWKQHQFQTSYQDALQAEQERIANISSELESKIDSRLKSEIGILKSDNDALVSEISTDNRRLSRKLSSDVDGLSERLTETESKIVSLRGFSDEAKYAYVKAEVEYFLQTANNRILLAEDIGSALSALNAADERLNVLRDPSLVRVRAEVRDEIQTLKALEQPDITGIALSLASVAKQVPSLPMRMHDDEDYFKEEIPMKEGEGWRVGLSNAWRSMRGTLDGLVEVRDATPSDVPMLSVQDEALLYTNLDLQLQSARLAALKQDQANYKTSLDLAQSILTKYFDSEENAVKAALSSIDELSKVNLKPSIPDISTSLKMLRAIQSGQSAESVLNNNSSTNTDTVTEAGE